MRIRFLGTDSAAGQSPTMFATDRGTLIVQGYKVTDARGLADVGDIPDGETLVEIPPGLLRFAGSPMDHDPRPRHGEDSGERS